MNEKREQDLLTEKTLLLSQITQVDPASDEYKTLELELARVGRELIEDKVESFDAFEKAYATAALWSSMDWKGEEEGNPEMLDKKYSISDLAPQTVLSFHRDCRDFQTAQYVLLEQAAQLGETEEQAGHDFWLSRNGHGAGFFDHGTEKVWKDLQAAAKVYGEVNLYVGDDELIYANGDEKYEGEPKESWEVNVGNVGNIDAEDEASARKTYAEYVEQSKNGVGRAGGETVTLLHNNESVEEFVGSLAEAEAEAEAEEDEPTEEPAAEPPAEQPTKPITPPAAEPSEEDVKAVAALKDEYEVDERGVIRSPGKFEAEPLYVPFLWQKSLDGGADEEVYDGETPVQVFNIDDADRKLFADLDANLEGVAVVTLMETEQGFVNAETYDTAEAWQKVAAELEPTGDEEDAEDLEADLGDADELLPYFDDEESKVRAAIKEIGYDVDDVKSVSQSGFGHGLQVEVGSESWLVFENDDEARQEVEDQVRRDLENEPDIFTQSRLQNFMLSYDGNVTEIGDTRWYRTN